MSSLQEGFVFSSLAAQQTTCVCGGVCGCGGGVLIIIFNKKLVDYQNKDLCCACSLELLLKIPFLNGVRENADTL